MASNYQDKIRERKLAEANAAGRAHGQAIKDKKRAEDAAAEWWATPTVPQPGTQPATNPPPVANPTTYGPPKPPYVVKDGDTVETVAANFGTTATNLLNSNPDVTSIVPGLVLNPPKIQGPPKPPGYGQGPAQGSEAWRVAQQNSGNMSYAPAAPQPFGPPKPPGYQGNNTPNPFATQSNNAFSNYGQTSGPLSGNGQPGAPFGAPTPFGSSQQTPASAPSGAQYQSTPPIRGMPIYDETNLAPKRAYEITNLYNAINTGKTPTQAQVNYLVNRGLIVPKPAPAYAGYGNGKTLQEAKNKKSGGGGGGGGGGGTLRTGANQYNNDGLPAFSSNSGFKGLVNWRL